MSSLNGPASWHGRPRAWVRRFSLMAPSIACAWVLAACATTSSTDVTGTGALGQIEASGEASIAFANQGGIQNWQPQGDAAVLLQDRQGQWYLARLQSPATELPYTEQVGFDPGPSGSFGRLSTVIVRGARYPVISLTRTDTPGNRQGAKQGQR